MEELEAVGFKQREPRSELTLMFDDGRDYTIKFETGEDITTILNKLLELTRELAEVESCG